MYRVTNPLLLAAWLTMAPAVATHANAADAAPAATEPFATEEVWSWFEQGSIHLASWPTPARTGGDPELLTSVAGVLAQIRKAKSTAKVTMKTPVTSLRVVSPAIERLTLGQGDLVNAGVVEQVELVSGDEELVEIVLGEPPAKQA